MPVIYLPEDKRSALIGQGLGAAAGSAIQNVQLKQTAEGVQKIMSDPSIADNDKFGEVAKQFGVPGTEFFKTFTQNQLVQAKLKDTLAQVGLTAAQKAQLEAKTPYAGPQAAATLAGTEAATAATQQATEKSKMLAPLEAGQIAATTAGTQQATARSQILTPEDAKQLQIKNQIIGTSGVQEAGAVAEKAGSESQVAAMTADRMRRMNEILTQGEASPTSLDTMLHAVGINDPKQAATYKAMYGNVLYSTGDPGKAGEAVMKDITARQRAESAAKMRADVPNEAETKYAAEAATHAESAQRFMDAFAKNPQKVGLLQGANLKASLESWGVPTGDPEVLDMWNASIQQTASAATSGGGFFAQGRVRLAKDVTPGITETPLHALISADQVADRMLANLNARIADRPDQKSLQQAKEKWEGVKKLTGSLQSYVVGPADKPDEQKSVVMFNGNQVDPKSFKSLVVGDKKYKASDGASYLGADIILKAKQRNLDPTDVLAAMGVKQ